MTFPIRRAAPVALALALALAGCVAPNQRPAPPPARPAPVPSPAPTPSPLPPPPPAIAQGDDWRDWPLTPGDWRYARSGAATEARYDDAGGAPVLLLRCESGQVRMLRATPATASATLRIRTTSGDAPRPARPSGAMLEADFTPRDPTLDAIAYSRGRFMLMADGAPDLIVPAWPEVARVIEDCRS